MHNQQAKSYHPNQAPVWVPHSSQPHRDEWANRVSDPLSSPRPTYIAILILILATTLTTQAQWDIEDSHTTASLRGIHNVGGGVAWASGTEGTVLRTEDGGYLWQGCATPPGAEKLDFRGIQAFDENTAIVMSSGKGDLSRLYKTTDGCRTWKLIFTNPDKEGFWDAIQFTSVEKDKGGSCFGVIIGDPIANAFPMFLSFNCGEKWERQIKQFPAALTGEGLFAASNSSLLLQGSNVRAFITGGPSGARILQYIVRSDDTRGPEDFDANVAPGARKFSYKPRHMQTDLLPWNVHSQTSGAFAVASKSNRSQYLETIVIVGGDYGAPGLPGFAAFGFLDSSSNGFKTAQTPPHGYRSSVAYDPTTKTWITVGPNGTDISQDDGRNWRPLKPTPQDQPDADKNWNALSLPFVVGPHGRIGKLRDNAIPTEASSKEAKSETETTVKAKKKD